MECGLDVYQVRYSSVIGTIGSLFTCKHRLTHAPGGMMGHAVDETDAISIFHPDLHRGGVRSESGRPTQSDKA